MRPSSRRRVARAMSEPPHSRRNRVTAPGLSEAALRDVYGEFPHRAHGGNGATRRPIDIRGDGAGAGRAHGTRRRTMSKKLWALAAVLGAAALAVAAVAPGASAAEPTPATNAVIGGTGVLDARGDGLVAVKGAMDYHASGAEAVLLVKDEGGNAFINVSGYGTTFHWNGFTAYAGFHGTAHI